MNNSIASTDQLNAPGLYSVAESGESSDDQQVQAADSSTSNISVRDAAEQPKVQQHTVTLTARTRQSHTLARALTVASRWRVVLVGGGVDVLPSHQHAPRPERLQPQGPDQHQRPTEAHPAGTQAQHTTLQHTARQLHAVTATPTLLTAWLIPVLYVCCCRCCCADGRLSRIQVNQRGVK